VNNKYIIFWLLNGAIDEKVSIAPRIEMLKELKNLGNEVTLIGSYKKNKIKSNFRIKYIKAINIPIISRIHFNINSSIILYKSLKVQYKINIIIVDQHSIYSGLLIKAIFKAFKKKKVNLHFDLRTIPVEITGVKGLVRKIAVWYPAIKLAKYFADSYSFISSEIEKIVDYKNKETCIWSSGVNIEKFKSDNTNKTKKNNKERVLFYHGVLSAKRGLRETIKAIGLLKDKIKNLKFVVVGDGSDLIYLKKMVAELGLKNYVTFKGKIEYENIARYIQTADVCICPLPDLLEWRVSSPLKVIEYCAMGKPCILTEINTHTKLFKKNTDGIYWAGIGREKEIERSILNAFNDKNRKYYYDSLRNLAEKNTWINKAKILNSYWDKIYQLNIIQIDNFGNNI
jgi:glycosyltransferase involved in cell wall biosynthesis